MTTLKLLLTPFFYCSIISYSKNVDVCKKLELNTLGFDVDMMVLSSKFKFEKKNQNFPFFPSPNENHRKSANFQDLSKKKFYMVSKYTLILYIG